MLLDARTERINKSRFKHREKGLEKKEAVNKVFCGETVKTARKVTFSRNVSDKGKKPK